MNKVSTTLSLYLCFEHDSGAQCTERDKKEARGVDVDLVPVGHVLVKPVGHDRQAL